MGRGRTGIVRRSLDLILPISPLSKSTAADTINPPALLSQMHHRSARMYFNLIAGQTYMEKEHVRHLQILDQIRRRGPNVHAKMNQKKARIEFMGKGHWRW